VPSTPTHDRITIIAGALLAPAYSFAQQHAGNEHAATLGLIAGTSCIVSGLWFSPDLDLDSWIHHRWGALAALWKPYKQLVPHRHWVSHGFVIGALLRLVYIACILLIVGCLYSLAVTRGLALAGMWVHEIAAAAVRHSDAFSAALFGFIIGSDAHIAADVISSSWKRRKRLT